MAGETTYADGYVDTAFKGDGRSLCVLDATHEITTTELQLADKIRFGKVPAGAVYVSGYIATDDLDSNGSPTVNLEVGDDDDVDGLYDGTTVGQAAGVVVFNGTYITNRTAVTAEKYIAVNLTAAAATAVAGTVRVVLYYYTP